MEVVDSREQLERLVKRLDGNAARTTRIKRVEQGYIVRGSVKDLCDFVDRKESRLRQVLDEYNPSLALPELLDMNRPLVSEAAGTGLLNTAFWVIAASASGARRGDTEGQYRALENFIDWSYGTELLQCLNYVTPDITTDAAGNEWYARTVSTQVRYFWIVKAICMAIAEAVETDPRYRSVVPELTVDAVGDLLDGTRRAVTEHLELSPGAENLARQISFKAGYLSGRALRDAVSTMEFSALPWVEFANGKLLPIAPLQAALYLDVALLELLDARGRRNGVNGIKGSVFELASRRCMSKILRLRPPSDAKEFYSRISPSDEGEIDLVLGNPVQAIFECKAKSGPERYESVAPKFEKDLSEAVAQIRLRASAVRKNSGVADDCGRKFGFACPLTAGVVLAYSYGALLYDPIALSLLPGGPLHDPPPAMMDLHSWILVGRACSSIDELANYQRYRQSLFERGVQAIDEFDILVAFIAKSSGSRNMSSDLRDCIHGRSTEVLFNYNIPLEVALRDVEPASVSDWRASVLYESFGN